MCSRYQKLNYLYITFVYFVGFVVVFFLANALDTVVAAITYSKLFTCAAVSYAAIPKYDRTEANTIVMTLMPTQANVGAAGF